MKKNKEKVFAKLIKKIRLTAFMTQKQFAKEIGVDTLCITFYETGRRQPRLDKLKAIVDFAKQYGINLTFDDFQVKK